MANFIKNKFATFIVVTATFILAGVAIFTAIRLYQLRNESISPTAPVSRPAANTQKSCEGLSFVITTQTPTVTTTISVTPSLSPTLTVTATTTLTPTQSVTSTPGPTATSTPGPTSTNTPTPSGGIGGTGTALPDAGISVPTIVLTIVGAMVVSLAVILAL